MTTVPPVNDAVQEVLTKSEEISARLDALTQTPDTPDFESREHEASVALEAAINEKNESEIRRLAAEVDALLQQELEGRKKKLEESEAAFDAAVKNNRAESPEVNAASEHVKLWRDSVTAFGSYIDEQKSYYNVNEILEHLHEADAPSAEAEPGAAVVEATPTLPENLTERMTKLRAKRDEYLIELRRIENELKIKELVGSISQ